LVAGAPFELEWKPGTFQSKEHERKGKKKGKEMRESQRPKNGTRKLA